jgi:hypothetical protein
VKHKHHVVFTSLLICVFHAESIKISLTVYSFLLVCESIVVKPGGVKSVQGENVLLEQAAVKHVR